MFAVSLVSTHAVSAPAASFESFVKSYYDGEYAAHPVAATSVGIHDYDSRVDDMSADGQARNSARHSVGGRIALQGNLDPAALFAPAAVLRAETLRVLDSYGAGPGHVFNLGHGITPEVDPERVAVLIDTVRGYALG